MAKITGQRRVKIFAVGFAPIVVLVIILITAAQFGLNVLSFMTSVESRNARDYVVRTKILGITLAERPATQADITEEDKIVRVVKGVVLVAAIATVGGCLVMCY